MATFKVMTFNIATCRQSKGGIIDVARTIEGQQADIVAMQEVDKFTHRSGVGVDQLSALAYHANYPHKLFIPAMNYQGGQYGNGILSKHHFDTVVMAPLGGQNQGEPRAFGIVSFKISKNQQLFFGFTHVEHANENLREAQVKELIELYRRAQLVDQPFILAGDFNDIPNSRTIQLLLTEGGFQLPCSEYPMTYPAENPTMAIDYIFMNTAAAKIFQVTGYRTLTNEKSSDHLALVLELKRK